MNSPCTKVCVMDADNRYCLGCRRTLGEIAGWSEMSESEQAAVLGALSARPTADADRALLPNVADRRH